MKKEDILSGIIDHNLTEYGIIISNKTLKTKKEENIIYIPPKTFALL